MAHSIKALLPFVGGKPIDRLHNDTLVSFIEARRRAGLATGTINKDLSVGAAHSESGSPEFGVTRAG